MEDRAGVGAWTVAGELSQGRNPHHKSADPCPGALREREKRQLPAQDNHAVGTLGCTGGTLCDDANPCPSGWDCIDGECGRAYSVPVCDNGSCTRTCQRGPEDGGLNPGDCPPVDHFVDCRQGRDTDEMVCGGGGAPADLACSTDADCNDARAIEWM